MMLPMLPFRGAMAPFWMLTGLLLLLFASGGGSREDIASLLIIRPVAAAMFVIGLFGLTEQQRDRHAVLLALMLGSMGLVALHLIPLPPILWQLLPDRDIVADIDRLAGLGDQWRPLSLVPWRTTNALMALTVPAAVLFLAIQLPGRWQRIVVRIILAAAIASAALAIMQKLGPPDGPLYLYDITSEGAAVGLFSNRNHHAIFLAACLPLLAFELSFAAATREAMIARSWIGAAVGLLLVAVLVATASRAGIALGAVALLLLPFLYRQPRLSGGRNRMQRGLNLRRWGPWALGGLAVLLVGVASSQALVQRIGTTDGVEELRLQIWGPIAAAVWRWFPTGSGIGSFVEAYQLVEPVRLLGDRYVNHAHNELLEVAMTAGLPGLLLVGAAIFAWGTAALPYWRTPIDHPEVQLGRVGTAVTALFALGSLGDYPLRTPSISAFFILAALWMVQGGTALAETRGDRRDSPAPESTGGGLPV